MYNIQYVNNLIPIIITIIIKTRLTYNMAIIYV